MSKLIVLAIGGNSLIRDPKNVTVEDQYEACVETSKHIAKLIKEGHRLVVTHGNGPQVGFILRRSEIASKELHIVPLDSCGADTQGAIGYNMQMALKNELKKLGINKTVATVVTQTIVDKDDPSFQNPTKPIGSFMDEETAMKHKEKDGWAIVEDAGRGYRRVVASPRPQEIVEFDAIKTLLDNDVVVIAVGGGGIPVVQDENGYLKGSEAVIDKDLASSLLAQKLNADLFIISTAVDKVYINYNKPEQKGLDKITFDEAKTYIKEGHFAPGSMLPKVKSLIEFIETTGNEGLITDPSNLDKAIKGETGTKFVP